MEWVVKTLLVKYFKHLIMLLVAWIAGHNLTQFGVTIDQNQLSLGIWSALYALRNYLKTRYKLGWL